MRPLHPVEGNRLALSGLDVSHAGGRYLGWLHDPEVTRFLEARLVDYDLDRLSAYIRAENERSDAVLFGMFLRQSGQFVGTIKLSNIRTTHRSCNIALMIGDKALWGRGYGTEAIALASGYAFDALNLHKILAGCYANNLASAGAFLKAGYGVEGRLTDDRWDGHRFVDCILLGKLNPSETDLSVAPNSRKETE